MIENNLIKLSKNNPILYDKILNHTLTGANPFNLFHSESGDVNLAYNNILIHCLKNPQQEAVDKLKDVKSFKEETLIVLVGLGLGYLFKRLYLSTNCKIIIFEPNLDILKFTLESVDLSSELNDSRAILVNNMMELSDAIKEHLVYKGDISIVYLDSANSLYPGLINTINENLPNIITEVVSNYNTLFSMSYYWLHHGFLNMSAFCSNYNLNLLEGKLKNKTALIVSPGPSLNKCIEIIKQNRNKYIIYCANVAYKKLEQNGIIPDFTVFIDNKDVNHTVEGCDLSQTNLIVQTIACNEIFKLNSNKKFIFYSNNDLVSRWVANIAGFDISNYKNKGTVSYCAMYSAFMMGCNPIILSGQDLAYVNGEIYASGSAYGDIGKFNESQDFIVEKKEFNILEKKVNDIKENNLTTIMGQNGEQLFTSIDYAGFKTFFEEFAYEQKTNKELKLVNCSEGGAQINGFNNALLNEFSKELVEINVDVNFEIEQALSIGENQPAVNKDKIRENLKVLQVDIENNYHWVQEGLKNSNKLIEELKKNNKNYKKINNLVNLVLAAYDELNNNIFQKHQLFIYTVFRQLTEMTILINDDGELDLEYFNQFAQTTKDIFYFSFHRLRGILGAIKQQIDFINNMSD